MSQDSETAERLEKIAFLRNEIKRMNRNHAAIILERDRFRIALQKIRDHDQATCPGIMPRDCLDTVREIARAALEAGRAGSVAVRADGRGSATEKASDHVYQCPQCQSLYRGFGICRFCQVQLDLKEKPSPGENEVARLTTWTATPPTAPGYYWHRYSPGGIALIVLVRKVRNDLAVMDGCANMGTVASYGGFWWPGPIPEPPEDGVGPAAECDPKLKVYQCPQCQCLYRDFGICRFCRVQLKDQLPAGEGIGMAALAKEERQWTPQEIMEREA